MKRCSEKWRQPNFTAYAFFGKKNLCRKLLSLLFLSLRNIYTSKFNVTNTRNLIEESMSDRRGIDDSRASFRRVQRRRHRFSTRRRKIFERGRSEREAFVAFPVLFTTRMYAYERQGERERVRLVAYRKRRLYTLSAVVTRTRPDESEFIPAKNHSPVVPNWSA